MREAVGVDHIGERARPEPDCRFSPLIAAGVKDRDDARTEDSRRLLFGV
jgi:hypothetical protein